MNALDNLAPFAPARGPAAPPNHARARPIEVDGVFLGAALDHELGVRFVAVDVRVTDMDQSIWPNADYALRSARQMFRAGRKGATERVRG